MKKVLHLLVQISLCVPTFVDAASIRLSPISLEMVDNQTASSLSIYNQSSESSNFQTRVFEWLQVDGKDQLIPTDDVVISPPVFKLPSDGSFNLRVVRVNATPVTDEKAYRIILDELPQPVDSRKVSQGVTVLLRSSLPLFVVNKNAFAQINWKIENSQNQPFLVLNNTGTRHALLSYLSIIDKTTNNSYPIPVNTVNGYILKKKMKSYAIGNNFKFQNNHQYNIEVTINGKKTIL